MPQTNESTPETAAEKKPIEHWARIHGHWDDQANLVYDGAGKYRAKGGPGMWLLVAMTKAVRDWPQGFEVTEDEFKKGIEEAQNHDPHVYAAQQGKR